MKKNIYYVKLNDGFSRFELDSTLLSGSEKEILSEDKLKENIESFLEKDDSTEINIMVDPSYADAPDDIKEIQDKTKDVLFSKVCHMIRELRSAIPLVFRHDSEITVFPGDSETLIRLIVYEPQFYISNEYGEKFLTHDWVHELNFSVKNTHYKLSSFRSVRLSSTAMNNGFQHPHQTVGVGSLSSYCLGSSALGVKLISGSYEPIDEFNIIMDLKSISEFVRQESISGTPHRSSRSYLKFGSLIDPSGSSQNSSYEIYEKNKESIINESDVSISQTGVYVSFPKTISKLFSSKVNCNGKIISDMQLLYNECAKYKGTTGYDVTILGNRIKGRKIPLTKEEVDECVNSYFNKEFKKSSEFIITKLINDVKTVLSKTKLSEVYFQD